MNKVIFFLLANLASLQFVFSQSYLKTYRYLLISCDNDYFFWFGCSNDRYYTAGNSIAYGYGAVSKSKIVNHFLPSLYDSVPSIFTFRIIQQINTPTYLNSTKIYFSDYPFAAALYATVARNTLSPRGDARWKTEFHVGVIGPSALGSEMQKMIHRITNSSSPAGWINQMPDELVLNYNIEYERRILSFGKAKHLVSNIETAIGTLTTHIQAGVSLNVFNRSGLMTSDYLLWPPNSKWTLLCSLAPSLRVVFWNGMLQGSPFDQHEHFYHVQNSSLARLLPIFQLKISVARGRHVLHGQQTFMGREFRTVDPQVYGTITYTIRLGRV